MQSSDVALAIDLGASSGRVIAAELGTDSINLVDVHRFENAPAFVGHRMHWDILRLWNQIEHGITVAAKQYGDRIVSLGVDTWGVDYVLMDHNDDLVGSAICYRDARTSGVMAQAFEKISRAEIFAESGIQFMEINTLYQLYSMRLQNSPLLDAADRLLMIPDFINWIMTGEKVNEATNASTTQMLRPSDGTWSKKIMDALQIPRKLFGPPVQPGTQLGGLRASIRNRTGIGTKPQVIVPATHDTGSAVIAVPANEFAAEKPTWCYISSGTWSLMGVELSHPILTDKCLSLNFTNESGAEGSVRLLKNIAGLWPFQQCRAAWMRRGKTYEWSELAEMARSAPKHQIFLDLDSPSFVAPEDMLEAISQYLRFTEQPTPENDAVIARATLECLALRYKVCLQWLEELLGYRLETIHIVGGGVQNELLCQMTADACQRPVIAGPVEATALGNVVSQMVSLGRFANIAEGRRWLRTQGGIRHYEPRDREEWETAAARMAEIKSKAGLL